jgi:putative inorganic carbon (hco3(-)) transporter
MAIGEVSPTRPDYLARRSAAAVVAFGMAILLIVILGLLGAPGRLVAVAALGVLGLGLLTRPKSATLLFVAVLYLNLPVVAMRFHGVDPIIAVVTPLLLAIPLLSYLVIRREPVVVTRALGWIAAYTAVLMLSSLFSSNVTEATESVANFVTEGVVLYVLVTNAVRRIDILKDTIIVLLVVGTFLGGLSLFQELTGTYENQYWGFAQTREVDPLEASTGSDRLERLSGPIGSKNRYAQAMLVLLPFSLYALVTGATRTHRVLAAVSGIAILAGMSLTYSRGAAVALAGLVVLVVLLRYVRVRTMLVVVAAMLAGVVALLPTYVDRIESLTAVTALVDTEARPGDGAILGRATSNLAALNVFADHPVLGVGPGRYQADYSQAYANELGMRHFTTPRRAHNLYLEVAADTGTLGIVSFLGIVGSTLFGLWRVRRRWMDRRPEYAHLATALFLAVTAYMLSGVFLHLAYIRYFWLLMAIANSAIWILHREANAADRAATSSPVRA